MIRDTHVVMFLLLGLACLLYLDDNLARTTGAVVHSDVLSARLILTAWAPSEW